MVKLVMQVPEKFIEKHAQATAKRPRLAEMLCCRDTADVYRPEDTPHLADLPLGDLHEDRQRDVGAGALHGAVAFNRRQTLTASRAAASSVLNRLMLPALFFSVPTPITAAM